MTTTSSDGRGCGRKRFDSRPVSGYNGVQWQGKPVSGGRVSSALEHMYQIWTSIWSQGCCLMDDTGFGSNRMAKLITFAGEDRHGRNDNTTKLGEVC